MIFLKSSVMMKLLNAILEELTVIRPMLCCMLTVPWHWWSKKSKYCPRLLGFFWQFFYRLLVFASVYVWQNNNYALKIWKLPALQASLLYCGPFFHVTAPYYLYCIVWGSTHSTLPLILWKNNEIFQEKIIYNIVIHNNRMDVHFTCKMNIYMISFAS